jgi:hypothetical protein
MSQWKSVFHEEVEGRPVIVKVYESDVDTDDDDGPAVRVETSLIRHGHSAGPITLEPVVVDDLEDELMEVGFSPEAAARIVLAVPR